MNINNITANNVSTAFRTTAPQFQPTSGTRPTNPVFRPGILSLGNIESPYQTYSAPTGAQKNENWCISDHYKISQGDIYTTLQAVRGEIAEADFSGMTDVEIYDWIEGRFIEAFGEDFMMAESLRISGPRTGGLDFTEVGKAFTSALYRQFGSNSFPEAINRQRLYGDMSTHEIQDSIRAKYPENLTNRELFLLLSELEAVGVGGQLDGHKRNYTDITLEIVGPTAITPDEYLRRYQEMLDKPSNLSILSGLYNLDTIRGPQDMMPALKEVLIRLFCAVERSDGLLESAWYDAYWKNSENKHELNTGNSTKTSDLEELFFKRLDDHYDRLNAERREIIADEYKDGRAKADYEERAFAPQRKPVTSPK